MKTIVVAHGVDCCDGERRGPCEENAHMSIDSRGVALWRSACKGALHAFTAQLGDSLKSAKVFIQRRRRGDDQM